jgi:hypothetical protein
MPVSSRETGLTNLPSASVFIKAGSCSALLFLWKLRTETSIFFANGLYESSSNP